MKKQTIEIMAQIPKENQNEYRLSKKGKTRNIGNVGSTYQKV